MGRSDAVPLVFERLTARFCPADQERSQSQIAATVTWTTWPPPDHKIARRLGI